MSIIEEIPIEDFPVRVYAGGPGRTLSEEGSAVRLLGPGKAIKFPCRWGHNRKGCGGTMLAHQSANRVGCNVHATCRDGVVYVARPA